MSTSSGDWTSLVPVTGEAVALDLRLAQFPSRTLGLALDLVVQMVALALLLWLSTSVASQLDEAAGRAIVLVSVVAVLVGMPAIIETLTRGRSLGKMATGLRVVRDDGGPVRFRHAFVRALFMMVDFWLSGGSVGLISSLASQRGKRLGDHFAGTVVLRERVPGQVSVTQSVYFMPPGLEGWAASLDLARLPDVTAMQARQFLTRTSAMDPTVRSTMGLQLAAEMSSYVAPPAPPGLDAETYLTVVLTERLRRASRSPAGSVTPTGATAPAGRGPTPPRATGDTAGQSAYAPPLAPPAGGPAPTADPGGPFALPR